MAHCIVICRLVILMSHFRFPDDILPFCFALGAREPISILVSPRFPRTWNTQEQQRCVFRLPDDRTSSLIGWRGKDRAYCMIMQDHRSTMQWHPWTFLIDEISSLDESQLPSSMSPLFLDHDNLIDNLSGHSRSFITTIDITWDEAAWPLTYRLHKQHNQSL